MKKAAIFLASGFEECEALITVDLLRRANIHVTMISIDNQKTVTGSHNITVYADAVLSEFYHELFDCIIMPGGMPGTAHLMESDKITEITRKHHAEGKVLAAICAAPSVYGVLNLLVGKQATCFPGFEENLKHAIVTSDKVVQDGNIITAKGLGAAFEFAYAIIKTLINKDTADKILYTIQY